MKNSLQTKIILIFLVMIFTILISMSIFSYVKIKNVYENSVREDLNSICNTFNNIATKTEFFDSFVALQAQKRAILLDGEYSIVKFNVDDTLLQTIDLKKEYSFEKVNNDYIFSKTINISENNETFHIIILQDTSFISNQLQDYLKMVYVLVILFIVISFIISSAISQNIVMPINKLRRNLEDIISGDSESIENIQITAPDNEVTDLVTKFKRMTNTMNDNVKELSSQKAQIETILLHMSDGVMAFDVYGNLIYENPSAKKLLNMDISNKKFDEIFQKLKVDIVFEKIVFLQELNASEKMVNIDDSYINMYFEPFEDEENVVGGVIVLLQDITKQVKLDEMRKEFVANVSHELKTPITTIKGYAEAILEDQGKMPPDTLTRFVGVISTEAQRMARLVTDLLQLSKFDINKNDNKKEEFDLGDLVKKTYEKVSIEAEKRGHKVECYVTADVPKIRADKDGIEQVVLNIISNSIKYTPDYGEIKIYVGFVYNHAYIKVIDNGIGIPKKDLGRVFERFYRVDKARSREQGGTGLGLAIAKEIIERNNGNIDIISEVNKGTEVIIRLPVKQNDEKK